MPRVFLHCDDFGKLYLTNFIQNYPRNRLCPAPAAHPAGWGAPYSGGGGGAGAGPPVLCTQDSQKACQGRICGGSPRRRRWLSPVGRAQPGHSLRPDDRYGRGFPPKQLYGSHLFLSLAGQPWRLYGSLPSDRHSGKAECGTEGPHFGGHFGSGRLIFSPTNWTNFIHF